MTARRLLLGVCLLSGSTLVAGPVLKLTSDLDPTPGPRVPRTQSTAIASTAVAGTTVITDVAAPEPLTSKIETLGDALVHSLDFAEVMDLKPVTLADADTDLPSSPEELHRVYFEEDAWEDYVPSEYDPLSQVPVLEVPLENGMGRAGLAILFGLMGKIEIHHDEPSERAVVTEEDLAQSEWTSPDSIPLSFEPGSSLRAGYLVTKAKTRTFSPFSAAAPALAPVPEPSTLILVGAGMAALGLIRRRRR